MGENKLLQCNTIAFIFVKYTDDFTLFHKIWYEEIDIEQIFLLNFFTNDFK